MRRRGGGGGGVKGRLDLFRKFIRFGGAPVPKMHSNCTVILRAVLLLEMMMTHRTRGSNRSYLSPAVNFFFHPQPPCSKPRCKPGGEGNDLVTNLTLFALPFVLYVIMSTIYANEVDKSERFL